jgi:hypothetical protein
MFNSLPKYVRALPKSSLTHPTLRESAQGDFPRGASENDLLRMSFELLQPIWLPTTETKLTQRPGCPPKL